MAKEESLATWLYDEGGYPFCSACSYEVRYDEMTNSYIRTNYCPNCGKRMRNPNQDENVTYDVITQKHIETPKEMIDFFNDIDEICKKHGFSISYDKKDSTFCIEEYDDENMKRLREAYKFY